MKTVFCCVFCGVGLYIYRIHIFVYQHFVCMLVLVYTMVTFLYSLYVRLWGKKHVETISGTTFYINTVLCKPPITKKRDLVIYL